MLMLLHVVPTYVFRKNERKKRMHATGIKGYDGYRARLSSALWTCVGLYCGQHATTTILLKNQIPIRGIRPTFISTPCTTPDVTLFFPSSLIWFARPTQKVLSTSMPSISKFYLGDIRQKWDIAT